MRHSLPFALAIALPLLAAAPVDAAKDVRVTVLSTMLVGNPAAGVGEWGFAAVLEVDGRRLLVDTGARAETVLKNAAELKVDLASITDLVITHNQADHTGGLLVLRRELAKTNPAALSRVHVPKGIFYPRLKAADIEELVETSVVGDGVVERLLYKHPQTGQPIALEKDIPFYALQKRIFLSLNGKIDPYSVDDYPAPGGHTALATVLKQGDPQAVNGEIEKSGLRGRGG